MAGSAFCGDLMPYFMTNRRGTSNLPRSSSAPGERSPIRFPTAAQWAGWRRRERPPPHEGGYSHVRVYCELVIHLFDGDSAYLGASAVFGVPIARRGIPPHSLDRTRCRSDVVLDPEADNAAAGRARYLQTRADGVGGPDGPAVAAGEVSGRLVLCVDQHEGVT